MTTSERVAYLKGLADGLNLDVETKEGKLLKAIIDVLEDIAFDLADVQDDIAEIAEQVDLIDEDLDALEEDYYDLEDEECGCGCGCGDHDEEDDDDFEGDLYEVTCGNCGDTIYLDDDLLALGSIKCPGCKEMLEFTFEEEEDEDK